MDYFYFRENLGPDGDERREYVADQLDHFSKSYIEVPKNQEDQHESIKFRYRMTRHNYEWDLPEYIGKI